MKKSICFCLVFFWLLLLPSILMLSFPVKDFSESENRMRASFPSFDTESLIDGNWAKDLNSFYGDRFPLRGFLLKSKAVCELLLGKRQNGNVFFGKELYQIKRLEGRDTVLLKKNKQAVDNLASHLAKTGKPCEILYAPRAIDALYEKLPTGYPIEASQTPWHILTPSPLTELLAKKAARGEAVWYRTDHHWSTLGAYYAYAFLGKALDYKPLPKEAFRIESVKENFVGTSASASQFPIMKPDSILRYRFDGDEDFVVTDLSTGSTHGGFYVDEKLASSDAYASFLGGNFAHLRITKSGESPRPLLLIIKDSYANCLVPFLARHFDIEMLDTRYIRSASYEMLDEITAKEEYAGALLLWNAETLSSDAGLTPFL